ncbi:hypothetical protein N9164_07265 [Draconibacterium sp.]|nr:hypothetical protein [Draconibacterium sp.]
MMYRNSNTIGKFYALLIFGFIIMVIAGIIFHNKRMNDYVDIRKLNHFSGVIIRIKPDRSSAFGKLKDGRKVFFFDYSNNNYTPNALNNFLSVGDSVVKSGYSDTIHVYRDRNEYQFVLGKTIEVVSK